MSEQLGNLEIAQKILASHGKELHVRDIATKAAVAGMLVNTSIEQFTSRLMASLSGSVKRKESLFSRVKNARGGFKSGVYRLKKTKATEPGLPTPEPVTSKDTGFIGRAGEYAVMSELLFRGFNVSLMTVDKGVDVVAANDQGKYFHIQVKTGQDRNGTYQFAIKRKSFDTNNNSQTFYIFVLRKDKRSDFIIFPNSQVSSYIAVGVIKGQNELSIRITYDSKTRKYLLNGSQDISVFANRFGQIC